MVIKRCELKNCNSVLGPGAAKIGYEIDGQTYEIKVCSFHTGIIQVAQPGDWHITKDRELKARPRSVFIKKGFK